MSIDIHLRSKEEEGFKITLEELKEKLDEDLKILDATVDDDGYVNYFLVEPKDLDNPENIEFEFHLQEDGSIWHPVKTRSEEGGNLDVQVVNMVEACLDLINEDY